MSRKYHFYCDGPACSEAVEVVPVGRETQSEEVAPPPTWLTVKHAGEAGHFCSWDCLLAWGKARRLESVVLENARYDASGTPGTRHYPEDDEAK